jgi:hypothetical protein
MPAAMEYDLVVYEVSDGQGTRLPEEKAVLRVSVPAGGTSWTPELGSCLAPGRYGWAVGAVEGEGDGRHTRWSRPAVFRVEGDLGREPSGPRTPGQEPVVVGEPPARLVVAAPQPGASRSGTGLRPATADAYVAPTCRAGGEAFTDVPASDPFCHWIEQMARDGIGEACAPGRYCPDNPVTRRQVAAMFERAMRGTATWSPQQGAAVAPPPGPNLTTVSATGDVGSFTSIAIGADGLPIISHFDFTNLVLIATHCNDPLCVGGDETQSTVDSGDVGYDSSITIGADGRPIISYFDNTNKDLKVAHCNDLLCAGGDETKTTADATINVGSFTSITIGADGLPIISYRDNTNFDLKVAHCNDLQCAGGDETKTTVDATGQVGYFGSITIGADGLPIVSYYDNTNSDLKVAHCANALCQPFSRRHGDPGVR